MELFQNKKNRIELIDLTGCCYAYQDMVMIIALGPVHTMPDKFENGTLCYGYAFRPH